MYTDLKGQKLEVVASGETDLEARVEIAGRFLSAWKDLRKWKRLLWWKEECGAPAVVLGKKKKLTAESNVKSILVSVCCFLRINWNIAWFSHLVRMVSRWWS